MSAPEGVAQRRRKQVPNVLSSRIPLEFRQVMANSGWLGLEQAIRLFTSFLTTAWFARQLGPTAFGVFSYAYSITTIAIALSSLGLNPIVVRDLVSHRETMYRILGTAFTMYLVFSVLLYLGAVGSVALLSSGNTKLIKLEAVLALSIFPQSLIVIDLWFQSTYRSKFTVAAKIISNLGINLVRIIILIMWPNIFVFAATICAEWVFAMAGLTFLYQRDGNSVVNWRVDRILLRGYAHRCIPLILAILAIQGQARADMVMLGTMCGTRTLGIYSAALRLIEMAAVLPPILATSLLPLLTRCKNRDERSFLRTLTSSYRLVTIYCGLVAMLFYLFGNFAVMSFYGPRFAGSSAFLVLLSLRLLLSGIGVIKQLFIISEGVYWIGTIMAAIGISLNITLNFFLIPRFGTLGAISSSLISFACTTVVLDVFSRAMRPNFSCMLKGMLSPWAVRSSDFHAPEVGTMSK